MSRKVKTSAVKAPKAAPAVVPPAIDKRAGGVEDLLSLLNSLIGSKEAAEILEVGQVRVQQFVKDGRLRGVKMQGRLYFDPAEVRELAKIERLPGRPAEDN